MGALGKAVRSVIGAVLAVGALAGSANIALADVKAGVDAWAAGNYDAAVREWQRPAAAGDPDAQFNLAQAYKLGRGVPRDLTKAEALYAAAAAKGHLQASDNYGLLLFQRGERARAMPYIRAAAGRGDARAQYIVGLALFNGDGVAKDWVRAYAYVSLAQQAGLPQANSALAQMDQHVSMADRQKSVAIAAQIAADAETSRARQVAAADLDTGPDDVIGTTSPSIAYADNTPPKRTDRASADAARAAGAARDVGSTGRAAQGGPAMCTKSLPCSAPPAANTLAARTSPPAARNTPATRAAATNSAAANGPWRLQLGAFGVPGNAEALWSRVKNRPELAGHGRLLVPAGKLTKLQVSGFASAAQAGAACARLKSSGVSCLATRD
jgi:hypothetical protein